MLNRISKTILVLTICLGISIPTNAAVSVSDGSAFVTKAEFAADLNNLSNRMAQLENSLDAKIDSLVSSYLTRNGIWNGAKQYNGDYFQFVDYADVTNDQWANLFRGNGDAFDCGWTKIGDGSSLTKTGLMMLKTRNFGPAPSSIGYEWWISGASPRDPGGYQIGTTGFECVIRTGSTGDTGSDVARIEVFALKNPTTLSTGAIYFGFKPYKFTVISNFMVNKGDYVFACLRSFGSQRSKATNGNFDSNSVDRSKIGIEIGDMTVY